MKLIGDLVTDAIGALLRNRRVVRAPVLIYRARLGVIFGRRLLMLEHQGRNTGASRYAVLEVIDHPVPDQYIVASGFGFRSQWLRNVQQNPHVRIHIASRHPAPATATILDRQEAGRALHRYADHHPRAWQQLQSIFEDVLGSSINEDGSDLPLVKLALDPTGLQASRNEPNQNEHE